MGVSSKKELIDLVSKYEGDDGLPTPGTATVALPCSGAVGRAGVGKMPMGEDRVNIERGASLRKSQ